MKMDKNIMELAYYISALNRLYDIATENPKIGAAYLMSIEINRSTDILCWLTNNPAVITRIDVLPVSLTQTDLDVYALLGDWASREKARGKNVEISRNSASLTQTDLDVCALLGDWASREKARGKNVEISRNSASLTQTDLDVCALLGISEEDFLKEKSCN